MDGLIAYALSKKYVDGKTSSLATGMSWKGMKENITDLPQSGNQAGDLWHVNEDGNEYAWDGSKWEALGGREVLPTITSSDNGKFLRVANGAWAAQAWDVIGAPGFEDQINEGVAAYFDGDPPFFELPSGGQSGQALLSDGNDGAYWGQAQSGGTGLSDDAKAALLACFRNVAWIGSDGQDYYDDLYDALYPPAPPATLLSISAAFNQGSAVIYDTDSLDTLKQYLTVTAYYDDSSTGVVTNYTLSGTLAVGTSTITVLYNGKTATFNVTVSEFRVPSEYQEVAYIEGTGTQYIHTPIKINSDSVKFEIGYYKATQAIAEESMLAGASGESSSPVEIGFTATANRLFAFSSSSALITDALVYGQNADLTVEFNSESPYAVMTLKANGQTLTGSKTTANNASIPNANINLFQTGDGFNTAKVRMRYARAITPAGKIADFIPCYRKSDSVAGLYDRITNTFFSSIGSDQFLKGGDV